MRVIITGANRGLGREVLRIILTKNKDYEVLATARTDLQEFKFKIDQQFPQNHVRVAELDIFKKQSIHKFVENLKAQNYRFDCLINNAAFGCDYGTQIPSVETATKTLITNFVGTVDLTEQILPLLKQNGRIINVSSKLGALLFHGKQIIEKYSNQNITLKQILHEVQKYIQGCQKGQLGAYYKSAYGTSKMMLNAWSRFILKKQLKNNQVAIAMSPGHCQTDMGKSHAPRTCHEGALSIYQHVHGQHSSDIFYHVGAKTDFINCGPH